MGIPKQFYQKYFAVEANAKYHNAEKGFSSYFLTFDSGARLELMQMASVPKSRNDPHTQFTGFIHLAISVGSVAKVDALTQILAADGYQIIDGPRTTGDGYYESTVLDPENNRIEITV